MSELFDQQGIGELAGRLEALEKRMGSCEDEMSLEEAIQVLTKRIETLEYLNLDDNLLRPHYRDLTGQQKGQLKVVKERTREYWVALDEIGTSRELSLAKTYLEEVVMWATKHIEK